MPYGPSTGVTLAEPLLRPANDSIRPLSVIEVELRVRPAPAIAGAPPRWRVDPQYREWVAQRFPAAQFFHCPLPRYKREVEAADAIHSMEEIDALLAREGGSTGGYALEGAHRFTRHAGFAVGSRSVSALLEFLFAWG